MAKRLAVFACLAAALFPSMDVSAASRVVIPDAYKYAKYKESAALDLSARTYSSHAWHGVAGRDMVSTNVSASVPGTKGSRLFLIPTVASGFTYRDCLDIQFAGVGWSAGRKLNATLHVNSVTFGPNTKNYVVKQSGNKTTTYANSQYASANAGLIMLNSSGPMEMFFGRSDQAQFFPGLEQRYDAVKELTVTVTVTYADNGQVVPFSFNHRVTDLDDNNLWNSYGAQEGVNFGAGYTGNIYVYSNSRLQVNGTDVRVPNDMHDHNWPDDSMTPSTGNGGVASNGEAYTDDPRVDEASLYMNGCWATTSGGSFTATYHGGNFSMLASYRSPFLGFNEPMKSGGMSGSDLKALHWDVEYDLPNIYSDQIGPLGSFSFVDTIPAGQSYQSFDVLLNGASVKGQFTGNYNSSNRVLTVSANSGFLNNPANYGKELTLRINCRWQDGVKSATNTPVVNVGGVQVSGQPFTLPNPAETTFGVYKIVEDPKDTYGVGDTVTYFVVVDFASFDGAPFSYPSDASSSEIMDFRLDDVIPDGLQLVGTPLAYSIGYDGLTGRKSYNNPNRVPITLDDVRRYASYAGSYDGTTAWPPLGTSGVRETTRHKLAVPLDEFFRVQHTTNAGPGIGKYLLTQDPGFNITVSSNRISVVPKPQTLMQWDVRNEYSGGLSCVGIRYQCKVTSAGVNKVLTNTVNVSAQNVGINYKVEKGEYKYFTVKDRINMSGSASASIRVNGYEITTEVVNGRIDPDIKGLPAGSSAYVKYVPNTGYYLAELVVDGVRQNVDTYRTSYSFTNIQASHHVKAVYAKGYNITTSAEHGTVSPSVVGLKPGSSKEVTYTPDEGYMIGSVTVDGVAQNASTYRTKYTFSNIRADHRIHVVFIPMWRVYTSIEHGTITPGSGPLAPGSRYDVTYMPEEGYYVKSVTVDNRALPPAELKTHLTAYSFANIQSDHYIHVVCAKVPRIAVVGAMRYPVGGAAAMVRVSGKDYLEDPKTFYFHLDLSGGSDYWAMTLPAGVYKAEPIGGAYWDTYVGEAVVSATLDGENPVMDTLNTDFAEGKLIFSRTSYLGYEAADDAVNDLDPSDGTPGKPGRAPLQAAEALDASKGDLRHTAGLGADGFAYSCDHGE